MKKKHNDMPESCLTRIWKVSGDFPFPFLSEPTWAVVLSNDKVKETLPMDPQVLLKTKEIEPFFPVKSSDSYRIYKFPNKSSKKNRGKRILWVGKPYAAFPTGFFQRLGTMVHAGPAGSLPDVTQIRWKEGFGGFGDDLKGVLQNDCNSNIFFALGPC